jgi:hypothetical protein
MTAPPLHSRFAPSFPPLYRTLHAHRDTIGADSRPESGRQRVVYRGGCEPFAMDTTVVEFRLTYQGPLKSTRIFVDQGGGAPPDEKARHKHSIRRHFHPQLKRISELRMPHWYEVTDPNWGRHDERIATKFAENGFRWLPLVRCDRPLYCSLSILYLRTGSQGGPLSRSDLDNRVKTLIDALKIPKRRELPNDARPDQDQDPFYVLLEDDSLVTHLSVETDTLLDPTDPDLGDQDSRVVIAVNVSGIGGL